MSLICVELDSPADKMQNRVHWFRSQLFEEYRRREAFRRITTYLSKVAVVLQHAPGRMLTFAQLMDEMTPLIAHNQKSAENNIRVCLSSNRCFVKVSGASECLNSKRSYWKLDCSQITAKMVRRHFRGLLQFFPELASKLESENSTKAPGTSAEPAVRSTTQVTCQKKFSSSFSVESLLKGDDPSAPTSRSPPLSGMLLLRVEQWPPPTHTQMKSFSCFSEVPPFLHPSFGFPSISPAGGSTHHRLTPNTSAAEQTEPLNPVYIQTSPASSFTDTHSSYITSNMSDLVSDSLWF